MNRQSEFVRFISDEYSIDFWSDFAIEQAIELANAFSLAELEELNREWKSLPLIAQARLAEVSSELSARIPSSVETLICMLSSSNPEVVEASLDSLHSICQRSPDRLDGFDVREALGKIAPTGKVCHVVLDSLKRKCA